MKSSFLLSALFFCLLTLITNGQNVLPQQTIENFTKSKELMINPDDDLSMHERSMRRDVPWQVSTGQRQDPAINPRANNRKKKEISKLNGSKYLPETVIVNDVNRYSYTYDDNGNEIIHLHEVWVNNTWKNYEKYTCVYDGYGNKLIELYEIWTNDAWLTGYRYTYTYNQNGGQLTYLNERWKNNAWVNYERYTFTYDNNGNWFTHLREIWSNNAWVKSGRSTFTYDSHGNCLIQFDEYWWNSWMNSGKRTYTYDNNRNKLTEEYVIWSGSAYAWEKHSRSTYTYDKDGNRLTNLYELGTNNTWVNSERKTFIYNNFGKEITYLYETWSDTSWEIRQRDTFTYDNNGNLLIQLSEYISNNTWVNLRRSTYSYNDSGNELKQLIETWMNNVWINGGEYTYTYDNNGNAIKGESFYWNNWDSSWVKASGSLTLNYNSRTDYIYFDNATTVNVTYTLIATDIRDNQLAANTYSLSQNYPNPFNPSTVIQYALPYESNVSISVYNTLGEVVKTFNEGTKQTGSYNVNFNGEGLSSGIYLYNINAVSINGKQNFQATKKMILIK